MARKILGRFRPDRITIRERRFLVIAGVAVAGILGYGVYLAIAGYSGSMKSLDRRIAQTKAAHEELSRIKADYDYLNQQVVLLDKRIQADKGRFSLLSYLEGLAGRTNIRSRISYMRPRDGAETDFYKEVSVEMKIEGVTLNQAIRFLTEIDKAPHVLRIKNLNFKTQFANPELMDVSFWVSTFEHVG